MNRQEVTLILVKASAAYPNQAPDLTANPAIFELWCEMLVEVEPQLGLTNLNEHIKTSSFFPTIADIAKDDHIHFYTNDNLLLDQKLLLIDSYGESAVDPPKHIIDRWCKRE